jgi:hypothetical protein
LLEIKPIFAGKPPLSSIRNLTVDMITQSGGNVNSFFLIALLGVRPLCAAKTAGIAL